jgi:murein DD-endopeptidase MepM/ murein hydrolase activator NlpD
MVLAVVLNTIVFSRAIVADGVGVAVPAADKAALLVAGQDEQRIDGEPLSIDPSAYEKIRRTTYVVEPGDTISEIAYRFDLEPGTILSMNPIDDVRRLLPGTTLYIPDRDGLLHAVQPGDSLSSIADTYGIPVSALADANDVESPVLQVGDALFVPGATMDEQDYLLAIGELFQWPVRSFVFTSGYGMRTHPITGLWHMHTGIDLANRIGTPVLAAGSGQVIHVEDQVTNYGKMIIIDHQNGFKTLYGHLNTIEVVPGEWVVAGERIGTMGSTGRSTGPHLHFSVINGTRMEDPTRHLP